MTRFIRPACASTLLFLVTSAPAALAGPCDTQTAYRHAETEILKARHTSELERIIFAKPAKLATGAADATRRIRGVPDAGENYEVTVTRGGERMSFAFRDETGRAGTLSFLMPATIGVFEVDPRGGNKDSGSGPTLYKEWRVNAYASGDGLFKAAVNRNTRATLILHGRGNACTSSDQFTDWTLQVIGPAGNFTLYGKLDSAGR